VVGVGVVDGVVVVVGVGESGGVPEGVSVRSATERRVGVSDGKITSVPEGVSMVHGGRVMISGRSGGKGSPDSRTVAYSASGSDAESILA